MRKGRKEGQGCLQGSLKRYFEGHVRIIVTARRGGREEQRRKGKRSRKKLRKKRKVWNERSFKKIK